MMISSVCTDCCWCRYEHDLDQLVRRALADVSEAPRAAPQQDRDHQPQRPRGRHLPPLPVESLGVQFLLNVVCYVWEIIIRKIIFVVTKVYCETCAHTYIRE